MPHETNRHNYFSIRLLYLMNFLKVLVIKYKLYSNEILKLLSHSTKSFILHLCSLQFPRLLRICNICFSKSLLLSVNTIYPKFEDWWTIFSIGYCSLYHFSSIQTLLSNHTCIYLKISMNFYFRFVHPFFKLPSI